MENCDGNKPMDGVKTLCTTKYIKNRARLSKALSFVQIINYLGF